MNHEIVYDVAASGTPLSGLLPVSLLLLLLVALGLGLRALLTTEGSWGRVGVGLSWGMMTAFLLFLVLSVQSALDSERHEREAMVRALRLGHFQTVEGPASFEVRDGKLVHGKPASYRVTATIANVRFYYVDPAESASPRFYGVLADGTPRLRVAYLKAPTYPKVLRVELAY